MREPESIIDISWGSRRRIDKMSDAMPFHLYSSIMIVPHHPKWAINVILVAAARAESAMTPSPVHTPRRDLDTKNIHPHPLGIWPCT